MKDYADKNILIFGGTSEGRILTETLASKGYACSVCVATEYGEQVLQQDQALSESLLSRVEIHTGRMDKEQMLTWIREHSFACVIDATHPYAIAVTENIKQAAEECNLPYFRLLRSMDENTETDSFVYKVIYPRQSAIWKRSRALFFLRPEVRKFRPLQREFPTNPVYMSECCPIQS